MLVKIWDGYGGGSHLGWVVMVVVCGVSQGKGVEGDCAGYCSRGRRPQQQRQKNK